jgi:hypothetical protein
MQKARKIAPRAKGVFAGIVERRVRGITKSDFYVNGRDLNYDYVEFEHAVVGRVA